VVGMEGRIYSVGDFDGATFYALDTSDLSKHPLKNLPRPRQGMAVAGLGGKLFVMGGSSNVKVDWVDIYDPASDTWTQGPPLKEAGVGTAAAELGGKLYLFQEPNVQEFDPATATWSVVAAFKGTSWGTVAVPIGDEILFGSPSGSQADSLLAFRPGGQIRPIAVQPPYGSYFAGVGGRLLMFSGIDASVLAFRPETGDWETLPRTLFPYSLGNVVGIGRTAFLFGADCDTTSCDAHSEAYSLP
jgi:hypothetical protein